MSRNCCLTLYTCTQMLLKWELLRLHYYNFRSLFKFKQMNNKTKTKQTKRNRKLSVFREDCSKWQKIPVLRFLYNLQQPKLGILQDVLECFDYHLSKMAAGSREALKDNQTQREFTRCVVSRLRNGSCPTKWAEGSSLSPWQDMHFPHFNQPSVRASFPVDLLILCRLEHPTDGVVTD